MGYVRQTAGTRGLKPGDGMSVARSSEKDRADALPKLLDGLPPEECVKYGFYMGEHYPGPIPDYEGNGVKREITMKNIS